MTGFHQRRLINNSKRLKRLALHTRYPWYGEQVLLECKHQKWSDMCESAAIDSVLNRRLNILIEAALYGG